MVADLRNEEEGGLCQIFKIARVSRVRTPKIFVLRPFPDVPEFVLALSAFRLDDPKCMALQSLQLCLRCG